MRRDDSSALAVSRCFVPAIRFSSLEIQHKNTAEGFIGYGEISNYHASRQTFLETIIKVPHQI